MGRAFISPKELLLGLAVGLMVGVFTPGCLSPVDGGPARKQQEEAAKALGISRTLTLDLGNNVTMKVVLIPPGRFMMGSPGSEKGRGANEGPQREVTLSRAYYMGVYEVTQEQYDAVMGANHSEFEGAKKPVESVRWDEAVAFCRKLSEKTKQNVRLPTEAEWEYACRAGTATPFNTGESISMFQANYMWNHSHGGHWPDLFPKKTTATGSFKPNALGLYDMHGNVREWCSDWYAANFYASGGNQDPQGPPNGALRVQRGGAWDDLPERCRSASRGGDVPGNSYTNTGFRVVVSAVVVQ